MQVMKVLKFGGSSVGSPKIIREVRAIVEQQAGGTIVVVSAFQGVTDQLIKTARMAVARDEKYKDELDVLKKRHTDTVSELIIGKTEQPRVLKLTEEILDELEEVLHGIFFLKDLTPKILDYVLSFGERLSAFIISEYINDACYYDARNFIKTDKNFGNASVHFERTNLFIKKYFDVRKNAYAVVPGFIASTDDNEVTTLGRGGSDYTAAIIAAALNASVLEIWTDVDGFMTADPRMVAKAYPIDTLTYAEAMELSHFGAKVIYTPTIRPVYAKNIQVIIKNTYNPKAKGTVIAKKDIAKTHHSVIKGISSIQHVALLTLQGAGLVGVTGTSMRLFAALARHKVNIILITQASSEYSISFAIAPDELDIAVHAIEQEFEREMQQREEVRLLVEKDLSVIAVVGEEMKNMPGVSAVLFSALGRNGINVIAVAQGSSELNISVVVRTDVLKKAMNVIHEGFFLSQIKTLNLYIIGTGNVGSRLINQIYRQQEILLREHALRLQVVGIANSKKMLIQEEGIDLANYLSVLSSEGVASDMSALIRQIKELNLPNSVLVDCTANESIAKIYKEAFDAFASVVTANKIACSSEYALYENLLKSSHKRGLRFLYETNVGAGLPVIKTIDELVTSGDRILQIDAVLSGTLNFIFNTISEEVPFSKAVRMAMEKGYAEPDPRIDLSGIDVCRKILILARQSGYKLEMDDVSVHPFLSDDCFKGSVDDFFRTLEKYDAAIETERKKMQAANKKWRFMASLNHGKASVQRVEVDTAHPAYDLEGSNNIIMLVTERYKEHPMIIKGYGAGAEVTAAGVFADIIRVANI